MKKKYSYITIDLDKKIYTKLKAVQGDSKSRYILVNLIDNNLYYDLTSTTVKVYGVKKDKTIFFNDATIVDATKGQFEIELTNQALAVAGDLKLQILILGPNQEKLSTFYFFIEVAESIIDEGAIESSNEFTTLITSLSKLEEWDGYFEETSGKIEEKYTERLNTVSSQLKEKANKEDVARISVGTPKFASDISEMTDITRNYVSTTDGFLYTYNGEVFVKSNVQYQSSGVADNTITPEKTTYIDSIRNFLTSKLNGIYWRLTTDGGSVIQTSQTNYIAFEPIKLKNGLTYTLNHCSGYFSYLHDGSTFIRLANSDVILYGYTITPDSDDYTLYVSQNLLGEARYPMLVNSPTVPYFYNNSLLVNKDEKFIPFNFKEICQLLDKNDFNSGKYWSFNDSTNTYSEVSAVGYYNYKIELYKGVTYYVKDAYAPFSGIANQSGTKYLQRFGTVSGYYSGIITPTENCILLITTQTRTPMLYTSEKINYNLPKGKYYKLNSLLKSSNEQEIVKLSVKKDGTGDYESLVECVNSITDSGVKKRYEIHLYEGIYDLLSEFGGSSWVNSIIESNGERQGLTLPDYVDLIGHGLPTVKLEVPDDIATSDFAKSVSTVNVYKNNKLFGINFTARNTRYVVHQEGGPTFYKMNVDKCTFTHLGNKVGYWQNVTAWGSGTASGIQCDFKDSIFKSPFCPFSMHNNANQETCFITLDGCAFAGGSQSYSVGFGYFLNNTNHNKVFIKNCILEKPWSVHLENSNYPSDNVWDIYDFDNKTITIGS